MTSNNLFSNIRGRGPNNNNIMVSVSQYCITLSTLIEINTPL